MVFIYLSCVTIFPWAEIKIIVYFVNQFFKCIYLLKLYFIVFIDAWHQLFWMKKSIYVWPYLFAIYVFYFSTEETLSSSSCLDHDYGIMDCKTLFVYCAGCMVSNNSYVSNLVAIELPISRECSKFQGYWKHLTTSRQYNFNRSYWELCHFRCGTQHPVSPDLGRSVKSGRPFTFGVELWPDEMCVNIM